MRKRSIAQLPLSLASDTRRVLLHPLPLFNNSIGAHDMGMMNGTVTPESVLDACGSSVRAMYLAGSFLPQQLDGREAALTKFEFSRRAGVV